MSRIHSKSPWLLAAVLAACSQPLPHHPRPMTESAERASMSADSAVAAKDMSVMRLQSVRAEERLGTRWGDEVQSNVRRVDLRRVSLWGSDSFVIENSTPKKAQNARKHKHAA